MRHDNGSGKLHINNCCTFQSAALNMQCINTDDRRQTTDDGRQTRQQLNVTAGQWIIKKLSCGRNHTHAHSHIHIYLLVSINSDLKLCVNLMHI